MASERIDVSLTDFIDFAIRAGTPKLSKVREIRRRGPYSPATDYWKPLREKLRELHETGPLDLSSLAAFAKTHPDRKKIGRYSAAVSGYRRFIGRKSFRWFSPPFTTWTTDRLAVRINPELGLQADKRRWVIKLYFKDEQLSKRKIDLLTYLMRQQLSSAVDANTSFAVLDVSNGKLYPAAPPATDLMPLLLGEARSFVAIWDALGEP